MKYKVIMISSLIYFIVHGQTREELIKQRDKESCAIYNQGFLKAAIGAGAIGSLLYSICKEPKELSMKYFGLLTLTTGLFAAAGSAAYSVLESHTKFRETLKFYNYLIVFGNK